jgi:squalene-associated FAD-dependent desaturase
VVIVGGGLAGLAAAVGLVGRDLRITIFESRPRLGGRASSFPDPATGELVDNCQHVSMACCTNLANFCRRVGTRELFRPVPEVVFLSPERCESRLRAGWPPAPLHLTGSFLTANYLTPVERLRVAWGMACLRFGRAREGESFASWLARHGQTERIIDRFWGTVLVSALNERLDRMDFGHARQVFIEGFLRNRGGYQVELPLVPLGDLYGARLEKWLADHQVEVRLKTGVRSIEVDDERSIIGVVQRDGQTVPADFVVLAVPFDRVAGLLPESARCWLPHLERIGSIEASPITGIHLWFDRPVCPYEHVTVLGRTIQWVFDHTALQGRQAHEGGGQYLQLVVSASYDLAPKGKQAIVDIALADLRALWPAAAEAHVLRSWVVTEHTATFAARPGIDEVRPPQRTGIDGLLLSGDWTATGWPATMEGAVRSGYLAAEQVLMDLGRPERLLRPDLPGSWLSNLLLGRPRRSSAYLPTVRPVRSGTKIG